MWTIKAKDAWKNPKQRELKAQELADKIPYILEMHGKIPSKGN